MPSFLMSTVAVIIALLYLIPSPVSCLPLQRLSVEEQLSILRSALDNAEPQRSNGQFSLWLDFEPVSTSQENSFPSEDCTLMGQSLENGSQQSLRVSTPLSTDVYLSELRQSLSAICGDVAHSSAPVSGTQTPMSVSGDKNTDATTSSTQIRNRTYLTVRAPPLHDPHENILHRRQLSVSKTDTASSGWLKGFLSLKILSAGMAATAVLGGCMRMGYNKWKESRHVEGTTAEKATEVAEGQHNPNIREDGTHVSLSETAAPSRASDIEAEVDAITRPDN